LNQTVRDALQSCLRMASGWRCKQTRARILGKTGHESK
jgi:hypothetical protein